MLIGALGIRGLTAAQVLDGMLNQRSSTCYIGRVLEPHLRHGDVLALHNLLVHKLSRLQ